MFTSHTLANPLTPEERLSVTRLIGHDALSLHFNFGLNLEVRVGSPQMNESAKRWLVASHKVVYHLDETVYYLSQNDEVPVSHELGLTKVIDETIRPLFPEITYELNGRGRDFSTVESIFVMMLYQSLNNAKQARRKSKAISIRAEEVNSFPSTATFIPEGAEKYDRFVGVHIHDEGKGFPQETPLKEYFERPEPPKGRHGFGLYFMRLAARVLQMPINIQSKPGDTTVTLYHPIYQATS